jgi:hypothetical protein
MNRQETRRHARRILDGLVDLYYQGIVAYEDYHDEQIGGMYEHKLASNLGYDTSSGYPPTEFLEGARLLEGEGFVRRNYRKKDFKIKGIWPTQAGLNYHDYVNSSPFGKLIHHIKNNWPTIAVSIVTAVVTTLVTLSIQSGF